MTLWNKYSELGHRFFYIQLCLLLYNKSTLTFFTMLWGKLLNMFLLNFLFFFWQITKPPAGDFSEKYFSAVDGGMVEKKWSLQAIQ